MSVSYTHLDSRKVSKNTMFIAISGFATDGHKYIKQAIENGASAIMVQEGAKISKEDVTDDVTIIMAPDTLSLIHIFNVSLPRVRDFRGLPNNSFDGKGNYSLGIKEQVIFPEIEYEKIDKVRGMDIIFVTTANSDEEAKELLSLLGMPFRA